MITGEYPIPLSYHHMSESFLGLMFLKNVLR